MSHINFFVSGGAPAIPTQFNTQDGNAVPQANVLLINAYDSSEDDPDGITTKGGVAAGDPPGIGALNEVDIYLTNRLSGSAIVVSGGVTPATGDIITFDLGPDAAVYRFFFQVTGIDPATGDGVGYTVNASLRTDGALIPAATIIQTPWIDADEDASLSTALIDVITSSNNMVLRVTGVLNTTINYKAVTTFVVVS